MIGATQFPDLLDALLVTVAWPVIDRELDSTELAAAHHHADQHFRRSNPTVR